MIAESKLLENFCLLRLGCSVTLYMLGAGLGFCN